MICIRCSGSQNMSTRVRETDELVERGVFNGNTTFRRCADFLWSVRCNIHFSGRAERLSFDMQREIAIRLGYTSHPGMQDVGRFIILPPAGRQDVGASPICASWKPAGQAGAGAEPHDGAVAAEPTGGGYPTTTISSSTTTASIWRCPTSSARPVNLIRIFRLAQKNNLAFHPDAMRTVTRSLRLINAPLRGIEANRLFMEILTSNDAEAVLRRMNSRRARSFQRLRRSCR